MEEQYDKRLPKRQRPRGSGGFLLSDSHPLQVAESAAKGPIRRSEIANGKRKPEDGELVVPKRRIGPGHARSAGGSPLTSEVKSGQDDRDNQPSNNDHERQLGAGSENAQSTISWQSIGPAGNGYQKNAPLQDTDPAQIVNIALSLSEGRRRHASGATYLTPSNANGGRRDVSGTKQVLGIPYGASGGSLRQQLRDQRRISRNLSYRSSGSADRVRRDSPELQDRRSSRKSSGVPPFETNFDNKAIFNASDATLARAAKARATLELGYEYRRLLRFMPDISRNAPSRSTSSARATTQDSLGLGRPYNPLQYIRNRKVRFREKKPLNPEIDGWKDVRRVKTWIDTIESQKEAEFSPIDDRSLLPPFHAVEEQPSVVDGADPNITVSRDSSVAPPIRPKLDWEFAPADLLADAYWMSQDRNLERIEDRSWQKIMQSPASYGGSSRTSKEYATSSEIRKLAKSTKHDASLDGPRKLDTNGRYESREGERRPEYYPQPISPTSGEDGSLTRRSRWPKKLLRSRSSSSSEQSDWSDQSRPRRGLKNRDHYNNAALEKNMMGIIHREAIESKLPRTDINGQLNKPGAKDASLIDDNENSQTQSRPQRPYRLNTDIKSSKAKATPARQSLDIERHHRRMSSEDLRTAPTSPILPGPAPSIAVDPPPAEASPENVPKVAPYPLKRPFSSRFGSFRRERSQSVENRPTHEDGSMKDSSSSAGVSRQITRESDLRERLIKKQSLELANGSSALSKFDSSGSRARVHESKHPKTFKDTHSSDSRLRGLFKGGKIADLVGSEVSRVGDILWKKDSNSLPSQLASPMASNFNSDTSDDETNHISAVNSSPSDNLTRVTTNNSGIEMKSLRTTEERPKYHMSNLPSFRSRFADTDQSSTLAAPLLDEDHIARQQRMVKERGRSFKFDRLAPPRIDMRNLSSSRSPRPSRSYDQDSTREPSRDSSGSRSTRGVRKADRALNELLGIPGKVGTAKVAPTGLATFASRIEGQHNRGRPDIKRQWSISDRGISGVRGNITKRDIARVRALLLSSGIKAAEIVRRNDEVATQTPALFRELHDVIKDPIPLVPASQEIVFAAQMLVSDIENTYQQLRDGAESFSADVVEQLHRQIKAVDERVNYKLTPMVRGAADDADAFSTELTTTHTLAVRQLNDSIDTILRRRRRRFRWMARSGWATLEWTVLSLMWGVWFIAVIVRIIRGTINGVLGGLRWLLFL